MEAGVKSVEKFEIGTAGDAGAVPPVWAQTGGFYWKKKDVKKAKLENNYTDIFIMVNAADKKMLKLFANRYGMTINALINEYLQYELKGVNYIVGVDYDIIEAVKDLYRYDLSSRLHIRVKSKIAEKYDVNKLVRNIIEKFRREVM